MACRTNSDRWRFPGAAMRFKAVKVCSSTWIRSGFIYIDYINPRYGVYRARLDVPQVCAGWQSARRMLPTKEAA